MIALQSKALRAVERLTQVPARALRDVDVRVRVCGNTSPAMGYEAEQALYTICDTIPDATVLDARAVVPALQALVDGAERGETPEIQAWCSLVLDTVPPAWRAYVVEHDDSTR